jgi:predicted phage tail protein
MTEFAEIDSRYFTGRIIKNITIDTPVIVDGLTVGETYKVTVQAINFFHVKSKNVITKTFTYNG